MIRFSTFRYTSAGYRVSLGWWREERLTRKVGFLLPFGRESLRVCEQKESRDPNRKEMEESTKKKSCRQKEFFFFWVGEGIDDVVT